MFLPLNNMSVCLFNHLHSAAFILYLFIHDNFFSFGLVSAELSVTVESDEETRWREGSGTFFTKSWAAFTFSGCRSCPKGFHCNHCSSTAISWDSSKPPVSLDHPHLQVNTNIMSQTLIDADGAPSVQHREVRLWRWKNCRPHIDWRRRWSVSCRIY